MVAAKRRMAARLIGFFEGRIVGLAFPFWMATG
jgi:hypothetical protein